MEPTTQQRTSDSKSRDDKPLDFIEGMWDRQLAKGDEHIYRRIRPSRLAGESKPETAVRIKCKSKRI